MSDDADRVEPDTKDWTWVLERPCPECGFEAGAVDVADLPSQLRGYADRWGVVLARPDARERPAAGVWSPLEYGAHVRDVCVVMRRRAELMLEQDAPTFPNWDQDAAALEGRYGEQDQAAVAGELRAAADDAAAVFAAATGPQWERTGLRSNGSRFTVRTLAQYFLHDVAHHLHDVRG